MPVAVACTDVWKRFYFDPRRPRKLKDAMLRGACRIADVTSQVFRPKSNPPKPTDYRWALQSFSLEVRGGEIVGVVGGNGAGKSTLLKLLSRILQPTRGSITVTGRLNAMIELGAGFHEDLTGRDNVFLAGSLLGLTRRQVRSLYGPIVEFAELADHMDTPMKYFSSGMLARLGFSIATAVEPDVLMIDEVLAVGDVSFQDRCLQTIRRFNHEGKAIIFVSHDMVTVRNLCSRVLWLKEGVTCANGGANAVVDEYLEHYWPGCTRRGS